MPVFCKTEIFKNLKLSEILFPACIISILLAGHFNEQMHTWRAPLALLSGVFLSLAFTNPYQTLTRKWVPRFLAWSIVGLGFGINLGIVLKAGLDGLGFTFLNISFCAIAGLGLGYILKNPRNTSLLITFGTAICGGSAIAAIAPVIQAKEHEITVAMGLVFLLNGLALFLFPTIGHHFALTQEQFGLWSALAIHDTSSVVGATMQYGDKALEIGTTIKLTRALWIVPLTLIIGLIYSHFILNKENTSNLKTVKKPWFIVGFIAAAALVTYIPILKVPGLYIRELAEQGLVLALFCIGANLSAQVLRSVGIKPLIQGVALWLLMAGATLWIV